MIKIIYLTIGIIRKIQGILKSIGYNLNIDGIYGYITEMAIRDFQKKHNLNVDGIVGNKTMEKLFSYYKQNLEEKYVNSRDLYSITNYLIWTDTKDHKVNVFYGKNRRWIQIKNFLATVGKPTSPTIKGVFKVGAKGRGFGGVSHGYYVKWYTQIYKNYLFHSILYNLNGSIFDGRLGMDLSDGCVRLSENDALYIYDNIPFGTTILIT